VSADEEKERRPETGRGGERLEEGAAHPGRPPEKAPPALEILDGGGSSLLEAVDSLLNRGVVVEGDLVLGLADVDLVYLRLTTLLAAADRILGPAGPPSVRQAAPYPGPPSVRQAAPYLGPPSVRQAAADPPATTGVGAELASARSEGAPSRPAPTPPEPGGAEFLSRAEEARIEELRDQVERTLGPPPAPTDRPAPPRWNAAPEDVERSVARLVLALVEFLRKLMERQAIRRMEEGTLTEEQVERLGQALMRLEETVHDMARRFGLEPEDLNLDLGPLGHLT
jgi:hypothetical protein